MGCRGSAGRFKGASAGISACGPAGKVAEIMAGLLLRGEVRGRRGMTSGVTLSVGRSGGDAGGRGLQAERTGRGWGELGWSGAEARAGRVGERKKRAGRRVRLLGRWERKGELGPGKEMGHGV